MSPTLTNCILYVPCGLVFTAFIWWANTRPGISCLRMRHIKNVHCFVKWFVKYHASYTEIHGVRLQDAHGNSMCKRIHLHWVVVLHISGCKGRTLKPSLWFRSPESALWPFGRIGNGHAHPLSCKLTVVKLSHSHIGRGLCVCVGGG